LLKLGADVEALAPAALRGRLAEVSAEMVVLYPPTKTRNVRASKP
jgi:hypothetical protein